MAPAALAQQGHEGHHPAGQPEAQAAPAPDAAMPMPAQGMQMQGMRMGGGKDAGAAGCPMMGGMKHDAGMNMGMGMPFEHI
jgi:hypothetical protein